MSSSDHQGNAAREAAAVAGDPFPLGLLVALGVDEQEVDACLQSGCWEELPGDHARFRDPDEARRLRDAMPWSRRRQLHRQFAELGSRHGMSPVALAGHLRDGGRTDQAREAFVQVAREAGRHQRQAEVVEALDQALALWPQDHDPGERAGLLGQLAGAARATRQLDRAAHACLERTLAAPVVEDPAALAATWRELAAIREMEGQPGAALEARRASLESFDRAGDAASAAVEALAIADILVLGLKFSEGLREAELAIERARRLGDPELESNALSLAGLAMAMRGRPVEARRRIEAGLELALRHGLKSAASTAYQRMPYVHSYVADYHGHRDATREAIDFCARESLEDGRRACLGCMAWAMLRTGDWKGASRMCREAISCEHPEARSMIATGVVGMLAVFRGQRKKARKLIAESEEAARRHGIGPMEMITRAGLALLDELEGDDASAARRYEELRLFWERSEDHMDILFGATRAATFFGRRGDASSLAGWSAVVRQVAADNGNPESLGSAAFVDGETALLEERPDEALRLFRQARECFARSELRPDLVQCDHREGVALLAAGETGAAIDLLRRCHRSARALGARPLMSAVDRLLADCGATAAEDRRPDSTARRARAGLTQRQHEVAGHIARGLTNKEIAVELGLSTRTIDMHVGNVLDRLNCRTRSEAVRRLAEIGALDDPG